MAEVGNWGTILHVSPSCASAEGWLAAPGLGDLIWSGRYDRIGVPFPFTRTMRAFVWMQRAYSHSLRDGFIISHQACALKQTAHHITRSHNCQIMLHVMWKMLRYSILVFCVVIIRWLNRHHPHHAIWYWLKMRYRASHVKKNKEKCLRMCFDTHD